MLAFIPRPFLNWSGRVNHFVVLADPGQASLEQFKGGLFALLVSLEGLLILTFLVQAPVAIRLWRVKQFYYLPLQDLLIIYSKRETENNEDGENCHAYLHPSLFLYQLQVDFLRITVSMFILLPIRLTAFSQIC